uniref:Uncharacterized protein n=1 Tax=Oryza glumipatula TaxID=40148 RepID=A0A0D9Z440_9ORYZ
MPFPSSSLFTLSLGHGAVQGWMWAAAQAAAADAAGGKRRRRAAVPRGGGRRCTGADRTEARGEAASPEAEACGSRSARGPWLVPAVDYTQSPEEEDAEETDDDEEAAAEQELTLAVGTAASVK